jgi:hypothetical protein
MLEKMRQGPLPLLPAKMEGAVVQQRPASLLLVEVKTTVVQYFPGVPEEAV